MTRRSNLWRASELARAASDGLILARAFDGVSPSRRDATLIEAEAALYAALELIWEAKEPARDRFLRIAGEVAAAPHQLERAA
jgi:hypothetical protein